MHLAAQEHLLAAALVVVAGINFWNNLAVKKLALFVAAERALNLVTNNTPPFLREPVTRHGVNGNSRPIHGGDIQEQNTHNAKV
jgi:hypothetical protein